MNLQQSLEQLKTYTDQWLKEYNKLTDELQKKNAIQNRHKAILQLQKSILGIGKNKPSTTQQSPPQRIAIKELSAGVGKKGKGIDNKIEDVKIVQQLLIDNGFKNIKTSGNCDAETIKAIETFQKKNIKRSWSPDGKISPGGTTWKTLNNLKNQAADNAKGKAAIAKNHPNLSKSFDKPVFMEVTPVNQMKMYNASHIKDSEIKEVAIKKLMDKKKISREKAVLYLKKKKARRKNAVGCKEASERMILGYLKKHHPKLNPADYDVAGFGTKSNYFSLAKENKDVRKNVVKVHGKRYDSFKNNALIVQDNADAAYDYLNKYLDKKIPVCVGVDHTYNSILGPGDSDKHRSRGYNSDKTTDHFIVIVGKGKDQGGTPYYLYINTGGNKADKAGNRLYPRQTKDGKLVWYDPKVGSRTYALTAICKFAIDVKNEKKTMLKN